MHLTGWLLSYLSFIKLQQTSSFFFQIKKMIWNAQRWDFIVLPCSPVQDACLSCPAASSFFLEFKFKIGSSLINYMINFILGRGMLFILIKHQLWWGPRLIVWIIKHQLLVSVTGNGQGKRLDSSEQSNCGFRWLSRIVWLTNFVDCRFCIFNLRLVGSTRVIYFVPIFWYR